MTFNIASYHDTYPSVVRVFLVVAHAIAIAGALLWLFPRTRKKASRFVLPAFAGLICFLGAFWNPELILRLDSIFYRWLAAIAPEPFVDLWSRFTYPTVYLLGAWVLGFALALQVVLWRENKRKQEPISVSD
jgi:hypothetical protein